MALWGGNFPNQFTIQSQKNNIVKRCQIDKTKLFDDNIDFRVNIMIWRAMKCIPYAVYMRNTYPGFCRVYMSCLFRSALDDASYVNNEGINISSYDPNFSGEIKECEFTYKILSKSSQSVRHINSFHLGCENLFNMSYTDGSDEDDFMEEKIRMGYYQYVLACVQILHHGTFRSGKNSALYYLTNKKKTKYERLDIDDLTYLLDLNMLNHPNNSEILLLCGWDIFFQQYVIGLYMMIPEVPMLKNVINILKQQERNLWKIPGQDNHLWPNDWEDIWLQCRPINCILNDYDTENNHFLKNSWVEFELGYSGQDWADQMWRNEMKRANIRWSGPDMGHHIDGITADGFNAMRNAFDKRTTKILDFCQTMKNKTAVFNSSDAWKKYFFSDDYNAFNSSKAHSVASMANKFKEHLPFTPESITKYFNEYLDKKGNHPLLEILHESGRTMSGAIKQRLDTKLPTLRVKQILEHNYSDDFDDFKGEGFTNASAYEKGEGNSFTRWGTCKNHVHLEEIRHLVSGGEGLPPISFGGNDYGARNSRHSSDCIEAAHTSYTVKSVLWTAANYVISKVKELDNEGGDFKSFSTSEMYRGMQLTMMDELVQAWNDTPYMFMPLGQTHYFVDDFDQCIECFQIQGFIEWIATNGVPKLIQDSSIPQKTWPEDIQLKFFWSELICYAIFGGSSRERTFWMPKPIDIKVKIEPMTPEDLYEVIRKFFKNVKDFKKIGKYKSTWSIIITCAFNKIFKNESNGQPFIKLDSNDFSKSKGVFNNADTILRKTNGNYLQYDFKEIERCIRELLLKLYLKTFIEDNWGDLNFVKVRMGYKMDKKCYTHPAFHQEVDEFDPDEIFAELHNIPREDDWFRNYWKQQGRQLKYSNVKTKSLLSGSRHPCIPFQLLEEQLDNWLEIIPTAPSTLDDGNGITVLEKYLRPFWEWPYGKKVSKSTYANKFFMSKAEMYNILTEFSIIMGDGQWFGINEIFEPEEYFDPYDIHFYSKDLNGGQIDNDIPIINLPEVIYAYDRWYVQSYMFLEERIATINDIICNKGIDPFRRLDKDKIRKYMGRRGRIKFNDFPNEFSRCLREYINDPQGKINQLKQLWDKYHINCGRISPFSRCLLGKEQETFIPRPVRGFENALLSIIGLPGGKANFEPRCLIVGIYESMSHEDDDDESLNLKETIVDGGKKCIAHPLMDLRPYSFDNPNTLNDKYFPLTETKNILIPIRSFITQRQQNSWYVQAEWINTNLKSPVKSWCQPVDILLKIQIKKGFNQPSNVFLADYMGQEEGIITCVDPEFGSKNGYIWDWCNNCILQTKGESDLPPPPQNKIVFNAGNSNLHPSALIAFYFNFGVEFEVYNVEEISRIREEEKETQERDGSGMMMDDDYDDLEMPFKNLKLKF